MSYKVPREAEGRARFFFETWADVLRFGVELDRLEVEFVLEWLAW